MAAYETIFILRPDLDEEAVGKFCDRIVSVVEKNGGSVIALEKMGHRRLSYEVMGHMDGYYVILNYDGKPETTRELERTFKITDEVIRHILVKREVPYKPAQTREAAKEAAQAAEEAPAAAPAEGPPAEPKAEETPVEPKAEETPVEPKAEETPAEAKTGSQ